MKLALFDIDGTVTDHDHLFDGLYVRTLRRMLSDAEIDTDWTTYAHVTDSGITDELFARHAGRAPTDTELAAIRAEYGGAVLEVAGDGRIVAGVEQAWSHLEQADWSIAFATGNWDALGRAKMGCVGLQTEQWPLAGADCGVDRPAILQAGVDRAEAHYDRTFSRVVYLGDAIWDLHTTRAMSMPFLAIGARGEELRAQGASHAVPDYVDTAAFLAAMEDARAPA